MTTWKDEDLALLREQAGSSSLKELAELLGRTTTAVRQRCRKEGLTWRDTRAEVARERFTKWTPERLAELSELAAEHPRKQVAEHFGLSLGGLASVMEDYGIQGRGRSRTRSPEERAQISQTMRAKTAEQYPPEGPWECARCHLEKALSEFPNQDVRPVHVCRTCLRGDRLRYYYNIEPEQYEAMLEAQDHKCAICQKPESALLYGDILPLAVDHDHKCCPGKKSCGKCVRALLCASCNHSVGYAEKLAGELHRVTSYLEEHGHKAL